MADSHDPAVDELVADFGERIGNLRREGVPSYPPLGGRKPWAETPELEKLEQIVWGGFPKRVRPRWPQPVLSNRVVTTAV